ncbi:MAG: DNA primase [Alphaproteobacteria bacterium]|jgi:DNA primase|nr:DNA primase [Alphaproteobacteria bacterium]
MSLPPQFLDDIRARVPASDVVGRSVRLTRRGREHVGLCPFHKEKTPSFTVNDDKAFFHCFGCGAHGDVIGFLMQHDGLTFPEAVERLAGEAGLSVPEPTPEARAQAARQATVMEALALADGWFGRALHREDAAQARAYLDGRGIDGDTIARFGIGWAPDRRHALLPHLAASGVDEDLAVEAGLARRADDGACFDFFRGRIIFPIADGRGRCIGFGGRVLGDGQPKYLNSPETPVFQKRRALYNLAAARKPARDSGTVIVAEGYMDVIALARAGFAHAVAPLGTALGEEQMAALWRLAAEPVLCLDGDAAGRRAASRAAERALPLLSPGRSLRFAFLPEGEDPDSLLATHGAAALSARLDASQPLVDVLWGQMLAGGRFDTPERKAGLRRDLDRMVATIRDTDVRGQYSEEFRRRFRDTFGSPQRGEKTWRRRPDRNAARPDMEIGPQEAARRGRAVSVTAAARGGDAETERRERLLLATLLNHPALLADTVEDLAAMSFAMPAFERLRHALGDIAAEGEALDHDTLQARLSAAGLAQEASALTSPSGWGAGLAEGFVRAEAGDDEALAGWRHVAALHRRAALDAEIAAATVALGENPSEEALAQMLALRHQRDALAQDMAGAGGLASAITGPT